MGIESTWIEVLFSGVPLKDNQSTTTVRKYLWYTLDTFLHVYNGYVGYTIGF